MGNERLEAKGLGSSVGREGQARRPGDEVKHQAPSEKAGSEGQVRTLSAGTFSAQSVFAVPCWMERV